VTGLACEHSEQLPLDAARDEFTGTNETVSQPVYRSATRSEFIELPNRYPPKFSTMITAHNNSRKMNARLATLARGRKLGRVRKFVFSRITS